MGYTIHVDKDVCISSGKCVDNAPSAFRFDEDDLAEPVDGTVLPDQRKLAIARNCPSGAIEILDGTTPVDIF
jgi:ferredoxin